MEEEVEDFEHRVKVKQYKSKLTVQNSLKLDLNCLDVLSWKTERKTKFDAQFKLKTPFYVKWLRYRNVSRNESNFKQMKYFKCDFKMFKK